MINVNLRPGRKHKSAGANPLKAVGERFASLGGKVKDPLLLGAVAAWVIAIGFLGATWFMTQRKLHAVEPQLEQARSEHQRFKTFLAQKHKQELIRDSLLAQISTIRTVDGDRYVWPHVLDEVSRALPAYTWLTLVTMDQSAQAGAVPAPAPKAGAKPAKADSTADSAAVNQPLGFRVEGRTVDIQAYTRFLRQLEASPWIQNVTPVSAQTVVEKERPVTAFVIKAEFRRADSAYIRTVPLSESVR
ncbi:MAG TPA: PilN domain-containing protein [Gemmatimonadales bacterium]|jgi:Tfp pilus assembly protein PilN|nr:PilN domain-containing protein [Gemmatimonadales bacterium]